LLCAQQGGEASCSRRPSGFATSTPPVGLPPSPIWPIDLASSQLHAGRPLAAPAPAGPPARRARTLAPRHDRCAPAHYLLLDGLPAAAAQATRASFGTTVRHDSAAELTVLLRSSSGRCPPPACGAEVRSSSAEWGRAVETSAATAATRQRPSCTTSGSKISCACRPLTFPYFWATGFAKSRSKCRFDEKPDPTDLSIRRWPGSCCRW
jgi:hypothetical protein